ncbi:diacylglycerol kinase [Sulfuricurvum kujiense DSM 16994]|uniref:Diacylglycerol kinase n=1 Tax=Sulfuricurvum kujiense (strain ATCC BAA-921 / DSM 16994 / JCM 11577 / YK-1) TaxID=709032 RepID=E4TYM5_SULKY|nr:diacylglycerol kinase [Sulfuricurvum kujiense]ADR34016.1 diacylglycerol kinase [Sulfuricurvum kujiense DSM 16994]
MALNKPEYTLFKNTRYALTGLLEVTKNEKSFRLQIVLFVFGMIVAWSLPIGFVYKAILSVSLFIPPIAEIINSAVERTVDLVTFDHHELAKRAKDAGAALVFLSLTMLAFIWGLTLYAAFYL